MLPPIEGLVFHEGIHRYRYQGVWLKNSVTGIASGELNEATKQRFEETKHIWAPRGLAVHKALEERLLDKGSIFSTDYQEWIDPLLDHWLWDGSETIAVEYRLADARKSLGGSFDFLIRTAKGKVCLGDLKTVGSASGVKSRKPATAQLGGYCSLLSLHHPSIVVERCLTVVAGPKETDIKVSRPQDCLDAWNEAWERHETAFALQYDF